MRNKTPKIALLLKRLLEAVKNIEKTANAEQSGPPFVRAEVNFAQGLEIRKPTADATDDRNYQRWTLRVQVATLVALVVYAVFMYFQWQETINATDTAQQAVHEARLTRQQSQQAFYATVNQFHLEQRAWIGVLGVGNLKVKVGESPQASVIVVNSGKTPAVYVKQIISGNILPKGQSSFIYKSSPAEKSQSVIQPGMNVRIDFPANEPPVTQTSADDIKYGRATFHIYGKITYQDVFGKEHYTTFCFIVTPDLTSTEWCAEYNDSDLPKAN
jgi:hypothetical protein